LVEISIGLQIRSVIGLQFFDSFARRDLPVTLGQFLLFLSVPKERAWQRRPPALGRTYAAAFF
jgi:hypothetical protein